MLKKIFEQLNTWMEQGNERRRADIEPLLPPAIVQVLGQTALIEAKVDLHLLATMDVDACIGAGRTVTKKLDELLRQQGRHWDPHSHEIWMPGETQYDSLYSGPHVEASLARADYVLLSKALKAPDKNRNLIAEYLAKGASELFLSLAEKYKVSLEQFV